MLAPSINKSQYAFSVDENQSIVYGLGAIKGVGESAIESILEARKKGVFTGFIDFVRRIDLRKVNKRVLEALIRSGALDGFREERSTLFSNVERVLSIVEQEESNKRYGQGDLFAQAELSTPELTQEAPWPDKVRLVGEKETLGLYLSGHPLQQYESELTAIRSSTIAELKLGGNRKQTIVGLIEAIKTTMTRKGDRIAFLTLDDGTGTQEVVVFSDVYQANKEWLVKDRLVVIEGEVSTDNFSGGYRMRCTELRSFETARMKRARRLRVIVDAKSAQASFSDTLKQCFTEYREETGCFVQIVYQKEGANVELKLGQEWRILPKDTLIESLKSLQGVERVELEY